MGWLGLREISASAKVGDDGGAGDGARRLHIVMRAGFERHTHRLGQAKS